MAYRAIHRYARISARKVRPLADMVRGKFADEALNILKYQPARGEDAGEGPAERGWECPGSGSKRRTFLQPRRLGGRRGKGGWGSDVQADPPDVSRSGFLEF